MAIEFRCPYCEATIRVADSAPGRVGKCPKCNTKMVVPKPSAALPPSLPLHFGGTSPAPPAVPDDEPVLLEENEPDLPDVVFAPADGPPAEPMLAAIEPVVSSPGVVPVIVPPGPVRRVVRRRQTKRPQVMWIIAVVMGLGLTIAAGYVVYREVFNGKLDGELLGAAVEDSTLPPVTVPRVSIRMVASALDPLLADLEAQPVPLVSELMEVKIAGSKDGLVIQIEQGARTRWYRVDAKSHPELAEFARKNEQGWATARVKTLDDAANDFLRDYQKLRQKEVDSSILPPYRDSLALPALVKGLGGHVVAVVGRTVYPCVYEQSDGSLYFLLPEKLKSFTLQGKPRADGKPGPFQGEFRVVIKRGTAETTPPVAADAKPEAASAPMENAAEETDEEATATKSRKKNKR